MENATKWILGGSALIGGYALLGGARLTRFSKEFILLVNPRVHSVTFTQLVLAIDIVFKNPTDATLRLKHPTVTAFNSLASKNANEPILSSTISDQVYVIKANSETALKPVMLTISLLDFSLIRSAYDILKNYLAGRPTTLYVRALTQVNGTIPVVQESEVTFQEGKKEQTRQLPKSTQTGVPARPKTVSGLSGHVRTHHRLSPSHGSR